MRLLILVVLVVYLVGVGVALAPIIQSKWNESTASDFSASVLRATPSALAWPARLYRSLTGPGYAGPPDPQTKSP